LAAALAAAAPESSHPDQCLQSFTATS
jgi:hypothetical protein